MDDPQPACFFALVRKARQRLTILAIVLLATVGPLAHSAQAQLFDAPPPPVVIDEVVLVSTRSLHGTCDSNQIENRLCCERWIPGESGAKWQPISLQEVLVDSQPTRRTVVYVHGNRIDRGEDRRRGLMVYRSLVSHRQTSQPIRLVIWSWPSAQIRGPVKDYHLKSVRSRQSGWQLAWFLDRMSEQTPVSIVGYSLGARVVSGALHLLDGGELDGLRYPVSHRSRRTSYRVALLAAAYDADWIQPRGYYGRALAKTDQLWLLTNRLDPAMRFYNLSTCRGRIPALGWVGVAEPSSLDCLAGQVHVVNVTKEVGRHHGLAAYLKASTGMEHIWRQLIY